jgi:hypothetical protein
MEEEEAFVGYSTMLSVATILEYATRWQDVRWTLNWKDSEGSDHSVVVVLTWNLPGGTGRKQRYAKLLGGKSIVRNKVKWGLPNCL